MNCIYCINKSTQNFNLWSRFWNIHVYTQLVPKIYVSKIMCCKSVHFKSLSCLKILHIRLYFIIFIFALLIFFFSPTNFPPLPICCIENAARSYLFMYFAPKFTRCWNPEFRHHIDLHIGPVLSDFIPVNIFSLLL